MLKTAKIIEMKIITRRHIESATLRIIFLKEKGDHHFAVFFYNNLKTVQIGINWFIEKEDYAGDGEITRAEMRKSIERIFTYSIEGATE